MPQRQAPAACCWFAALAKLLTRTSNIAFDIDVKAVSFDCRCLFLDFISDPLAIICFN